MISSTNRKSFIYAYFALERVVLSVGLWWWSSICLEHDPAVDGVVLITRENLPLWISLGDDGENISPIVLELKDIESYMLVDVLLLDTFHVRCFLYLDNFVTLCAMAGFNLVARAWCQQWFFIAIHVVHVHIWLGVHSAVVKEFLVLFDERFQLQYLSGINHCCSLYLISNK